VAARRAGRRFSPSHLRLAALGVGLVLAWVAMGGRLYQVQVVDAAELADLGLEQRLTTRELAPQRGNIFDRNGDPMAMTVEAESLFVVPQEVTEPVFVAQQVGGLLGLDQGTVLDELRSDKTFVYLKRQVELDLASQVTSLELAGVYSHDEAKRVYPTNTIASHVVGFVDIDGVGKEGLEYEFNDSLRGIPGEVMFERAPDGTPIPWARSETTPAVAGSDLVTTIDLPIQYAAERACVDTLQETGAEGCWIVALEVETGEVLAMAGAPEFDPATRQGADGQPFSNFIVRGTYEPGSTQKLISVAGAIEEGVVSPETVIDEVGDFIELRPQACVRIDDDIFGCYRDFDPHAVEDMTVADIFRSSSNVGTIRIAQLLPSGTIPEYMERFGLGQQTGIDYSGEAAGLIGMDASCEVCPLSAAIGYGIAVTPMQMAAAYAAVANDGLWVQPHLVASHGEADGSVVPVEPATHQVVSADTAWVMRHLLAGVVESGTGHRAQVPGYRVGGKTGTANKLGEDGRYTDLTIASFVGMAPIDDPKVVVAVVVDNPSFEYRTGGLAAAPAFSAVMEQALHRLAVTPDGDDG
jgi:cell division protein FtsI (penicillin-binding protein 3)